jgi:hypothetical protein
MTWDHRLYFFSEGRCAGDFFALKNPTASAGFETANFGTKGQHATFRPPKPLLYTLRCTEDEKRAVGGGKGNCTRAWKCIAVQVCWQTWNFQSVSGLYKNFTRMSASEFEFLINMIGEKISKKAIAFRKPISVQERLALTLRFSATGDSYVSLQYLFKISKQAFRCIVPDVCKALVEKSKDYIQGRQILLFLICERSLKLD